MAPLIGISAYLGPASWRAWSDVPAVLIPQAYVDHVLSAGGIPLIVPPSATANAEMLGGLAERLDGLILAGGPDLDPASYGQAPHRMAQEPSQDRDAAEMALLSTMRLHRRPVLGICRGVQIMAVAAGGQLIQHLPDTLGHDLHSPGPGVYGEHEVTIAAGSTLHSILGPSARVASHHHQGVSSHPGHVATAWAPDGTLEAIEDPELPFCVGVLWHPEVGTDQRLFRALVAACVAAR